MSTNKLYIGIDPSINSTGLVMRVCDDAKVERDIRYYIIKGDYNEKTKYGAKKSALTKKEAEAQQKYDNFSYVLYNKYRAISKKDATKTDILHNEFGKTLSFACLTDMLTQTVNSIIERHDILPDNIYVVIEGISYGSTIRTSSVFDLAGLNYMIRYVMMSIADNIIISPPSHIKKFATGVGNANKELMTDTFKAIHPELDIPKADDIADAYFMSKLAEHYADEGTY